LKNLPFIKDLVIYALGGILIVSGVYTFYSTTSILFDWFGGRAKAGNYVRLALIASFICCFFYLVCGVLFFLKNKLATPLLFIATIIMFIGYIAMLFHIKNGNAIELHTIAEMLIRTTGTMLYAGASWYIFTRTRIVYPPGHNAKTFRKLMKEYSKKELRQRSGTSA